MYFPFSAYSLVIGLGEEYETDMCHTHGLMYMATWHVIQNFQYFHNIWIYTHMALFA